MIYLLAYDIADDKKRLKMANLLEEYGQRVQKSVFECRLNSTEHKNLLRKSQELIEAEDSVRIYPLCQDCLKKVTAVGKNVPLSITKGYIII